MKKTKLKLLKYQNYLAMVGNSAGVKMFRNVYVFENGEKKDILGGGENSCAYFVSCVLKIFDLIFSPHTTVRGTINDMLKSGWRETKKLKPGNVVLWEEIKCPGDCHHPHLGFFLEGDKVISNSHKKRMPLVHHLTFGSYRDGKPKRKIVKIFTHSFLRH